MKRTLSFLFIVVVNFYLAKAFTTRVRRADDPFVGKFTQLRQSAPMKLFECMLKLKSMRCVKLYSLVKLEKYPLGHRSGNLTEDFISQFFSNEVDFPSLVDSQLDRIPDQELTRKLVLSFRKFFNDQEVKVNVIPGFIVYFKSNVNNGVNLSLSKEKIDESDEDHETSSAEIMEFSGRHRRIKKKKDKGYKDYKQTVMQIGLPALMMPAIIMGSFLPFVLPAIKMATIMSLVVNNGALIAALMHAARTHVMNQETEIVHYSPHGAATY